MSHETCAICGRELANEPLQFDISDLWAVEGPVCPVCYFDSVRQLARETRADGEWLLLQGHEEAGQRHWDASAKLEGIARFLEAYQFDSVTGIAVEIVRLHEDAVDAMRWIYEWRESEERR